MARKSANEKRIHELTLELFAKKSSVTPSEIEEHVGAGPYSSKYIWFLRKLGHNISATKNGRKIITYNYISGADASVGVKPEPVKKEKNSKNKPVDDHEDEEENTTNKNVFSSSYAVDPDWDIVTDIRELI